MDTSGQWAEDPKTIEDTFCKYFQELFSSSNPTNKAIEDVLRSVRPIVDRGMNERLLAPFTESEVEKVVAQMFPIKALDPDGSPASFYKKILEYCWAKQNKQLSYYP